MIQTRVFNPENKPNTTEKENVIDFLFKNLQEYGDPRADIEKAIDYALKETKSFGGFILVSYLDNEISGAVVVNQTGMKDYIPENILVYIATHKKHRGQGIGKILMQETIKLAEGNIALHVEPENPARFLYEKYGFSSKYIEMRYIQPSSN
ncbi:ribosomal protein S18 acetylase RimI-like enzyme [Ancylomarina subtilis]|uniref:Ribosomal protein S18 acetylase RimI-like enzyme n=1 Tax=Ancylomarina subtilis TaxID=1639035 RepID=A0A4Q7VM68_9BACT|nr:GNAT family N-acetyltransferase [Ancylomarina subtilis]RZT97362.1 ribosomal protein S18 acetylase RimI-like enzyme [Ancylomarina subtilis]